MFSVIFCIIFLVFGSAVAPCPDGTVSSFSDKTLCYLFQTKPNYFLTAEKSCNNEGGHLVTINEVMDNVYLAGLYY